MINRTDLGKLVQEALCLNVEEREIALNIIDEIKFLIHDIKEADSDIEGKYSSEIIDKIINYIN